jgi:glycerophosphoryl diester phosphodiesterase
MKQYNNLNIWSHRGVSGKIRGRFVKDNSPKAVQLSIDNGFTGFEVDIFFNRKMKKCVVSHDLRIKNGEHKYNLINGKLLLLDEIFKILEKHKNIKIWIDIKNLNRSNYKTVYSILKNMSDGYDIDRKNIYIESKHSGLLSIFDNEFNTLYWVYFPHQLFEKNNHTMLSMTFITFMYLRYFLRFSKKNIAVCTLDVKDIHKYANNKTTLFLTDSHNLNIPI